MEERILKLFLMCFGIAVLTLVWSNLGSALSWPINDWHMLVAKVGLGSSLALLLITFALVIRALIQ